MTFMTGMSIAYYAVALFGIVAGVVMLVKNIQNNYPKYMYFHPFTCVVISAIAISIGVYIGQL
jgi:hypothetical protein